MAIRRMGRTAACFAAAALLLAPCAGAQQGTIRFTGRLVSAAAPFASTGVHSLMDGSAARTRQQAIGTVLRAGQAPELLAYFAAHAPRDARLIVTTYE